MAGTTTNSTCSLDAESLRLLSDLARRLGYVADRGVAARIRSAAAGNAPALDALDRLQASVRERNADLEQWWGGAPPSEPPAAPVLEKIAVKGFEPLTQRI